jgi:hypothetical protein
MIIISWLIDWFQVHEWHGLNTRSRAYQMSEGSGTKFKFLKFHRSFPGKNILIQSNLLYKLVNFIWVFVVDEFDEWLTLSPWDWSSRVRFSSNSSTTHFYFYCFLVLLIYIMVLPRNVVSFWISYLKMLQMLKNLFF